MSEKPVPVRIRESVFVLMQFIRSNVPDAADRIRDGQRWFAVQMHRLRGWKVPNSDERDNRQHTLHSHVRWSV